jgi:hypothetical protein
MLKPKKRYMVDEKGKRVGVFMGLNEYRKLLEELEELETIRAYDAAKAAKEQPIPFEQAVKATERKR